MTPKSLFGRSLLILLTPLLLVQVILSYVYFDRHLESVLNLLADNIAADIKIVALLTEQKSPVTAREAAQCLQLNFSLVPGAKLEKVGARKTGWLYDFMGNALHHHLNYPYYLSLDRSFIHVLVQLPQGVLKVTTPRKRLFTRTTPLVLIWTTLSALLLFIVASLFMRNQIKPLWRLAQAAERFGKGQEVDNLRPEGATEVRKATHAFNTMRDRIRRQIQERMDFLAGVSHDLRTPLARMKLQLALMKTAPEVQALAQDVTNMQKMLEGFLGFAHSAEEEIAEECSLPELLQEVTQCLSHHPLKTTINCPPVLWWSLKVGFVKRCLTNLLLNSSKYSSEAWVTVQVKPHVLEIWVEDNGPGIPEAERENVFRPFYRSEASRSLESGGTGLGLSIARDAVRRHGGKIWLADSSHGGLKVIIRLPR